MFYVWRLAIGVCCDFTHSFLTTVHIKPAYCTFSRICRAIIITLLLFKYFLFFNLIYSQPDSWHQYGPSTQFHYQDTDNAGFVNISPGFFHAKEEVPRLERLTSTEWTESVQKMSSLRNDDSNNNDKSSVFGGFDVSENKQVSDLSSVNGNITLQNNVSARDVNVINGNIEISNNVQVNELSTVNGDIQAQTYLLVKRDVSTVNGNITFAAHTQVDQDVTTVNGDIKLTQTVIGDDVKTQNGSITLTQGSIVEGDIEFESQDDSSWWGDKTSGHNPPTLTIDKSSNVKGKIILRQIVVLEIENPALLAKVERRYKGKQ